MSRVGRGSSARWGRSRLVVACTVVACVALAAVGVRLAEAGPEYDYARGRVGQPVEVQEGEVTVERVRVGTQLARDGDVVDTTPGMFVVVSVTGAASGTGRLLYSDSQLRTDDGRVYEDFGSSTTISAEPGFAEEVEFVYEVDPARIDDLTLEMWQLEIINGFQDRLQVHLGITPGNADDWRVAARDQVIDLPVGGTTRVIG